MPDLEPRLSEAYAGCRARVTELVSGMGSDPDVVPVPGCPKWSVHDVVAHMVGIVDDVFAGRLDGVATEVWTEAQVSSRRGQPTRDLLEHWVEVGPQFDPMLAAAGPIGHQAIADTVTHEHDIRGALDAPGYRDTDAVHIGLDFSVRAFVTSAHSNGVTVRIETEAAIFGTPDADLALDGYTFDLLRAITGRRSEEQIRAMAWTGDVEKAVPLFTLGPFRPSPVAIYE